MCAFCRKNTENGHRENDPKLHLLRPRDRFGELAKLKLTKSSMWTWKLPEVKIVVEGGCAVRQLNQFDNGRRDPGTWPTGLLPTSHSIHWEK